MAEISIGELRDRIDVQTPVRSQHPNTGETLTDWKTTNAGVPAKIETSQTETEKARKNTRVSRHVITVRFVAEWVNNTDIRVIVDGEQCQVVSAIDPDRKRRWLEITAAGLV